MNIDFWVIEKYRKEADKMKCPVLISTGDPEREAKDINSKQIELYFSHLQNYKKRAKVLDIGAGEMWLKEALKIRNIEADYYGLDISTESGKKYDFYDIDSVTGEYDLVIMQEVIEHLNLDKGLYYLKKAYEILSSEGFIAVTIPNILNPIQFFKDFSHVTYYPITDLYAILRSIGFQGVAILRRIEIKPYDLSYKKLLIYKLRKILFRIMGFDFPHGVMCMIGKK